MDQTDTIRLLDGLAEIRNRPTVAAHLADGLDADALFAFVPDPERPATLIPVEGFPTMPARRGWQDLLAQCAALGDHAGVVAYPDRTSERPACAYVFPGLVFVTVGHASPCPDHRERLGLIARVLAALFGAEATAVATRGEIEVERQNSERTTTLAGALDRARSDAERANRVKDEFLAMLGHELRNPLAPMVTALQLLRMEGVSTRAQDVLERQVGHVMRLVDDLLDVSRITSGKLELRREPLELASVVARALEMARPLLEQRRNQVVVEVPDDGLCVDGDPSRLAQVVGNLVTNAAKYSAAESTIELRAARDGGMVTLAVTDHGVGIAAPDLARVFDQFVQVPQGGLDRGIGGLGLGLAIVRSLVELHGGKVRAISAGRGHGSTFIVELPACERAATAASPATAAMAPVGSASTTVLLVDDNVDAAQLLGEVLEAYGYRVQIAHSGPDALDGLQSFRPDAALLDIGLPVMDGYELAQRLRARIPAIKLIALTGYGQANDRARSRDAGFDAHLVKPVMIERVTEVLRDLTAPGR